RGVFTGRWALPGGRVQADETLEGAARRLLAAETGVRGIYLEQLYTFGHPERDPHGRVVSVAYFALIPHGGRFQDRARAPFPDAASAPCPSSSRPPSPPRPPRIRPTASTTWCASRAATRAARTSAGCSPASTRSAPSASSSATIASRTCPAPARSPATVAPSC